MGVIAHMLHDRERRNVTALSRNLEFVPGQIVAAYTRSSDPICSDIKVTSRSGVRRVT